MRKSPGCCLRRKPYPCSYPRSWKFLIAKYKPHGIANFAEEIRMAVRWAPNWVLRFSLSRSPAYHIVFFLLNKRIRRTMNFRCCVYCFFFLGARVRLQLDIRGCKLFVFNLGEAVALVCSFFFSPEVLQGRLNDQKELMLEKKVFCFFIWSYTARKPKNA